MIVKDVELEAWVVQLESAGNRHFVTKMKESRKLTPRGTLYPVQINSHELIFTSPYVLLVINEVKDILFHRRHKPYSI